MTHTGDSHRSHRADFGDGGVLLRARDCRFWWKAGSTSPEVLRRRDGENGGRKSFGEEDGMSRVHIDSSTAYRLRETDASRVAAFFDLDGTLLPLPSLERRFVAELRIEALDSGAEIICGGLRTRCGSRREVFLRSIHANKSAFAKCSGAVHSPLRAQLCLFPRRHTPRGLARAQGRLGDPGFGDARRFWPRQGCVGADACVLRCAA